MGNNGGAVKNGDSLNATKGDLNAASNKCIVSFPARWGQQFWNQLTGIVAINHACVWTGRSNSKVMAPFPDGWWVQWEKNVVNALAKGQQLVVCVDEEAGLGNAQKCEVKFLNGVNPGVYVGETIVPAAPLKQLPYTVFVSKMAMLWSMSSMLGRENMIPELWIEENSKQGPMPV